MKYPPRLFFAVVTALASRAVSGVAVHKDMPQGLLLLWTGEDGLTNFTVLREYHPPPPASGLPVAAGDVNISLAPAPAPAPAPSPSPALALPSPLLPPRSPGRPARRGHGAAAAAAAPQKTPLPVNRVGCGRLNKLDGTELAEAERALAAVCDGGAWIPARSALAEHRGGAWAYVCNWSMISENPCDGAELAEAAVRIDDACGPRAAGWVLMQIWLKGIGREIDTVEFC